MLGGARSSVKATTYGLESQSRPGTCSAADGVGGPTADLVEVGKRSTAATSPPEAKVGLLLALALGWRQPCSVAQTFGALSELDLIDVDAASEFETSGTGCIRQCGRTRAAHGCFHSRRQLALLGAVSQCTCETKRDALHILQVVGPIDDPSHTRGCSSVIAIDKAPSAARAAELSSRSAGASGHYLAEYGCGAHRQAARSRGERVNAVAVH